MISKYNARFAATIVATALSMVCTAQESMQMISGVEALPPASFSTSQPQIKKDVSDNLIVSEFATIVKDGDTVTELILELGIYPDTYSLEVVERLNPGIADLDVIKSGSRITLPRARIFTEDTDGVVTWEAAISIRLRPIDSEFRLAELMTGPIVEYRELVSNFDNVRFPASTSKPRLVKTFELLDDSVSALSENEHLLSPGAKDQIESDLLDLELTMERMSASGTAMFKATDLELIQDIQTDMTMKADAVTNGRKDYSAVEATVKSNDNRKQIGYSVKFIRWKDRRNPKDIGDFDGLASVATLPRMSLGQYKIWGEKDLGNGDISRTADKKVSVLNDIQPFTFDLVVVP